MEAILKTKMKNWKACGTMGKIDNKIDGIIKTLLL